jgi:hypothetical protein
MPRRISSILSGKIFAAVVLVGCLFGHQWIIEAFTMPAAEEITP